jgi:putative Mg2+ transporter-C (MgtC) family protein
MTIWTTIQKEFSDLPDAEQVTRVCVRLLVAIALGGILGYERETKGTSAGLRTHMLVALGAALFVLVPLQAGMSVPDMSRVLQGVVSGIGFLGAGAIIKLSQDREIRGLTTAASIWLTAAIGVAAGMGMEATAIFSTLLALVILALLHRGPGSKANPEE